MNSPELKPTPETDGFYAALYDPSVPASMIEHASGPEREQMRKLERQRDAAREDAERLATDLRVVREIIDDNKDIFGPCVIGNKSLTAHEALKAGY